MYKLSKFLKEMGEMFPTVKKATTKPLWEKWITGRQNPTHKQMEKFIRLLPEEAGDKKHYYQQAFLLSQHVEENGVLEHSFPVLPMACPRPRFTKYGRPYMPKKYMDWKKNLAKMMESLPIGGLDGAVQITLEFHFFSENKSWGIHQQKPDVDNLIKAVLDSAQDSGLILDDDHVNSVTASKFWGYEPKIIMKIQY